MEYWFYHLESATLESCLPQLLEKTLERGWRAQVQFASPERAKQIDAFLWSYKADSFLPHGRDDEPRASDQPIIISHANEIAPADEAEAPDLVFLVDGVDPVISETAKGKMSRLISFVDSRNTQSIDMARTRWSAAKASGAAVSYWRQDMQGRWAKQG